MGMHVNGDNHEYTLELNRALGTFERQVALAGSGQAGEVQAEPDREFREMMDRLTRLAYTDGFEKGWKAARKIRRA